MMMGITIIKIFGLELLTTTNTIRLTIVDDLSLFIHHLSDTPPVIILSKNYDQICDHFKFKTAKMAIQR